MSSFPLNFCSFSATFLFPAASVPSSLLLLFLCRFCLSPQFLSFSFSKVLCFFYILSQSTHPFLPAPFLFFRSTFSKSLSHSTRPFLFAPIPVLQFLLFKGAVLAFSSHHPQIFYSFSTVPIPYPIYTLVPNPWFLSLPISSVLYLILLLSSFPFSSVPIPSPQF